LYNTDLILRFVPAYIAIYLFALVMEKVRESVQQRLEKSLKEQEDINKEKQKLIHELQEAIDEVTQLQGILPICSHCKKVRDDTGYWEQVEKYVQDRSEATFSHSLCPDCIKPLYPDFKQREDTAK
jgi:hypothetical protein